MSKRANRYKTGREPILSDESMAKIARLRYDEGLTVRQLSERFGVSCTVIKRAVGMGQSPIRGTWVQDPVTGKLILKVQFVTDRSLEAQRARSPLPSPQVMRDIEPFRNVAVDGAVVGSRSEKREMMKRHGLVEVGNEKLVTRRAAPKRTPIVQSIKRSIQELSGR